MAGTYVEKIVYGMDKIHVAKLNEETGQYEAPIQILGQVVPFSVQIFRIISGQNRLSKS